jgi:LuxR family transcriptional regulator, maltose regulon positive regulatory protein
VDLAALADQACRLYSGPLLPGDDDQPWVLQCRQRLAGRFLRFVTGVGQRLEDSQRLESAALLYQQALERDPLAETLYRRLMIVQVLQERRAEALQTYARCRQALAGATGAMPSAETEAVRRGLLAG